MGIRNGGLLPTKDYKEKIFDEIRDRPAENKIRGETDQPKGSDDEDQKEKYRADLRHLRCALTPDAPVRRLRLAPQFAVAGPQQLACADLAATPGCDGVSQTVRRSAE